MTTPEIAVQVDRVTAEPKTGVQVPESAAPSLFAGLDAPALLKIRVRPVEFARLAGVSRQSVSRWIRGGVIALGLDGRLDPSEAMRMLLARGDPARMRASVLRTAARELGDLRAQAEQLQAAVAAREAALRDLQAARAEAAALRTRLAALEAYAERAAERLHALVSAGRLALEQAGADALPDLAAVLSVEDSDE